MADTVQDPVGGPVKQAISNAVSTITTSPGGAAIATGTTNIIADMIEYFFLCHDEGAKQSIPEFFHLVHPGPAIEIQMATALLFLYHGIRAATRRNKAPAST